MKSRLIATFLFGLLVAGHITRIAAMDGNGAFGQELIDSFSQQLTALDADPVSLIRSSEEARFAQEQNTVLIGHKNVPFALYRRDLIEAPFLIIDLILGYLFFKYFKQKRCEHIYKIITQNVDTTLTTLNDIKKLALTLKQQRDTSQEYEDAQKALEPIMQELAKQYEYIGYNPFKLEALIPLSFFTLAYKASAYAQQKCIIKRTFIPEAHYAWKKQANGSYEQFKLDPSFNPPLDELEKEFYQIGELDRTRKKKPMVEAMGIYYRIGKFGINLFKKALFWSDAPLSIMTAIKTFVGNNPNASPVEQSLPLDRVTGGLSPDNFWNKFFYISMGLPNWLYTVRHNPKTARAIEICGFLIIPGLINSLCQRVWLAYLTINSDELIELLEAYKATQHLSHTDTDKLEVEKDLKTFIETGNSILANNIRYSAQEFFSFKWVGTWNVHHRVNAWMTAIVLTILLAKKSVRQGIYNLTSSGILLDLPPEVQFLGLFIALECLLIFGPILAAQGYTVYSDLVLLKDWVMTRAKKIFSKTECVTKGNNTVAVTAA